MQRLRSEWRLCSVGVVLLVVGVVLLVAAFVAAALFHPADAPVEDATVRIGNFGLPSPSLTVKARSKAVDNDDRYAFAFNEPGSYQRFCSPHLHMTGAIGQWMVDLAGLTTASNVAILVHGVLFSLRSSHKLDTRLDTPPISPRHHPVFYPLHPFW
jgi:hypothetical protein